MSVITVRLSDTCWGWDFSTQPVQTDHGLVIEAPCAPYYVGNVAQIERAIAGDKTYNSLGSACHADAWFYDHKKIIGYMWFFTGGGGTWEISHDMRGFNPRMFEFLGGGI